MNTSQKMGIFSMFELHLNSNSNTIATYYKTITFLIAHLNDLHSYRTMH